MALIQTDNKVTVGKIERVKTGIKGLDELLSGGIPKESITLVSGPPGSGKSIFCYQFIAKGARRRKKMPLPDTR